MAFELEESEGGLRKGSRYEAFAKRADGTMAVLAFVFLVVWSARIAFREYLPGSVRATLLTVQGLIWLVFLVDLIIRVALHKQRFRWLISHPLDVIAVIIPAARPLKVLSVFTSGTMLASRKGVVKSTQAVVIAVLLLIWIGAVAILDAERGHDGAQIVNFGDALWWALVTMTTVGYGDFAPVTVEGRVVATVIMLIGVALIGVVTASVAAWFVSLTQGQDDAREEEREEVTRTQLLARIDELETKIDRMAGRAGPGASGLPHLTPKPPSDAGRRTEPED
ncbi:potassium channel family protein [Demequina mangrovi]|uniref:Voltage-gated potassium channel n=1 Tax=Demequina mangrovi TaxID=1043493 RepID=A0A1H6UWG4_9MICO|nr:potassium channel family protein [Demequina mangrovi]SEI93987.1 voltage-gated potassium channel [Demequina mangrovi]